MENNLDVLIPEYLTYCEVEKSLASKTRKAYQTDLLQFADFINSKGGDISKG